MTRSLKGKTLFVTGASRGIGLAIALRAARDGANVAIAAKSAEPHPKLAGTIHSAAAEIEAAGGKALAMQVDVREEAQVQDAARRTAERFGGIDILVNNASAISLTGTLETQMKRYDLMHGINTRGTFVCSQACLPYLLKAANPHVLNISPPLGEIVKDKWFRSHTAYTMAKFGMTLCAMGMAAEFKERGVAFNTLWPRTTIATAAIDLLSGPKGRDSARKPEIMADAAWYVLTRPSRSCSGQYFVDDEVLRAEGIADLTQYAYKPGARLQPDFFVEPA